VSFLWGEGAFGEGVSTEEEGCWERGLLGINIGFVMNLRNMAGLEDDEVFLRAIPC
jgi:hypothetical protein